jgi:hypothetical protein
MRITIVLVLGLFVSIGCRRDGASPTAEAVAGGAADGAPGSASAPSKVIDLAGGNYNACAVTDDGRVWCWGRCGVACNGPGVPPAGGDTASMPPQAVLELTDARRVVVGDSYACALLADGSVRCWGSNWDGPFGKPEPERSYGTVGVPGVEGVVELVAAQRGMLCARRADGSVLAWGGQILGADRNPEQMARRGPTPVPEAAGAEALFPRGDGCCARTAAGELRCWDGRMHERDYVWNFEFGPAQPAGLPAGTRAVGDCDCVLAADRSLHCEAYGLPGAQLADGTTPPAPLLSCSIERLADVESFFSTTGWGCAVLTDGRAVCWGFGGVGTPPAPLAVPGRVTRFARTLMGANYALNDAGEVWAWGENSEHGIPGRDERHVAQPVKILP